ncbi:Uncharacterised protein [uncultured archaeon]|nr:Uncharacterised protein [uncultured archaeon]
MPAGGATRHKAGCPTPRTPCQWMRPPLPSGGLSSLQPRARSTCPLCLPRKWSGASGWQSRLLSGRQGGSTLLPRIRSSCARPGNSPRCCRGPCGFSCPGLQQPGSIPGCRPAQLRPRLPCASQAPRLCGRPEARLRRSQARFSLPNPCKAPTKPSTGGFPNPTSHSGRGNPCKCPWNARSLRSCTLPSAFFPPAARKALFRARTGHLGTGSP